MAAGDINSRSVHSVGDLVLITGTIEVDTTARAYAIGDSNVRIVSLSLTNQDTMGSACLGMLNSNNGVAESLNGTIWVDGPNATDTVEYSVLCTGPV
jgi:hypothetical protein